MGDPTARLILDVTDVHTAEELHEELRRHLGFPDFYGGNWDAFWDCITGMVPLPEQLVVRGLDHLEQRLPREARLFLETIGDYNNRPGGRSCGLDVTDDYATDIYFFQFEARPALGADVDGALGAFIDCWLKADSRGKAEEAARSEIANAGWVVISLEDEDIETLAGVIESGEDDEYIRQACVDGAVFVFNTWDSDDPDDDYISADERKENTEKLLRDMGVWVNESLPLTEPEVEAQLRSAQDVARRCLCLLAVAAASDGVDRGKIQDWMTKESIWPYCSPEETTFLEAPELDKDQAVQFSWRSEALWVLLWSLGAIDELKPPTEQCDIEVIMEITPGPGASTNEFVEKAKLRPVSDVLDATDFAYRAHWATRNKRLDPDTEIGDLIPGVVWERHYALNWLTCYGDEDWDDVTTDT